MFMSGELVVISPDMNMMAPLEMFLDRDGRSLADRFAISYSPSLVHFVQSPPPRRERRTGGQWRGLIVRAPGVRRSAQVPDDLKRADQEVAMLAAHMENPVVLTGAAASEARLSALARDGLLGSTDLIHIASHADGNLEGMHTLHLQLAQPVAGGLRGRGASENHDGRLTFDEVARWRLRARLVTLASCRSAGVWSAPSEGTPGMGQAFLFAGARSAIVSLWPVEDEATALFMTYFYDALFERASSPCSISAALMRARLRLKDHQDASGARPYAHPLFWAGFVLLGDPG